MIEKYLPDIEKIGSASVDEQRIVGGLCHHTGAAGSQLYDMKNIMPAEGDGIKTRMPHRRYMTALSKEEFGHGLCVHNGQLYMARGTGLYRIDGVNSAVRVCAVSDSDKTFASFGQWLFVLPDRVYVNSIGVSHPMDVSWTELAVTADGQSLTATGVDWLSQGVHVGDCLSISGTTASPSSGVYRVMTLQSHTLVLDRTLPFTGAQTVSVSRWVPPLEHLCTAGDRLMGCAGRTVYVSEAGHPFNWQTVSGQGSSAPSEILAAGQGRFTGCACWQGYGLFFKEDRVYKLMGSGAYGYYLTESVAPGVAADAAGTLCVQGGAMYYNGVDGVYRYEGSYPVHVSVAMGCTLAHACGSCDGRYYYLAGIGEADMPFLYALDTQHDTWYKADDSQLFRFMATMGQKVYALNGAGEVWQIGNDWEPTHMGTSEETLRGKLTSVATWGYEPCRLPVTRRLQKVSLLADARTVDETQPTLSVQIAYDEDEEWTEIGSFCGAMTHRLLDCPIIPRACDSYRLRAIMTGDWTLYRMYRSYVG